ncbi:MAG TPA: riboflavin synthase [Bacteroidia bacterium]|nr:riboflavin synthase [Bacteroidia bacterium]HNU31973.1 riboflavin synthase [Bacteroidia bacterium]
MFTGIVEEAGKIVSLAKDKSNLRLSVACSFVSQIKIDQSIAHNGVCLTVVEINLNENYYKVIAVEETLKKTNMSFLKQGRIVNLERCMLANGRLDGHIVQGHVDAVAVCTGIEDLNGSWKFIFENDGSYKNLVVQKGSVCVNGVSLTVVDAEPHKFSVVVIPYTFEHTNFCELRAGDKVNIEFDILGKYAVAYMAGSFT